MAHRFQYGDWVSIIVRSVLETAKTENPEPPVRLVALVGKGEVSPLKSTSWVEVMLLPHWKTLEGKLVWTRRKYSVKRGKIPATFRFSVLDNGVVSNMFWTIVDVSDDLSWGMFHYNGTACVAGQSYTGAVLVTPDGSYPVEKERERLQSALEKCGLRSGNSLLLIIVLAKIHYWEFHKELGYIQESASRNHTRFFA
ncbi:unnamed protein product [Arabis nemorensis]|uniref:Uncharacterized protein n=1 Tax=Arabis nemorensis TaxID=586526 RepID=A0A565BPM7_9BRAS|nr:unnamed protein product [Arabis nemorensis]